MPVVVDFWGEYCPPCRALAPILDDLALEFKDKVKIGKVDVGNEQGLATEYNVTAVPTLLFFKQGQVTDHLLGLKSRRELKDRIDRLAA